MNSLKDEIKSKIWDQAFESCRDSVRTELWNNVYRRELGFIECLRFIRIEILLKVFDTVNEIS
jgi:hypothetical protein